MLVAQPQMAAPVVKKNRARRATGLRPSTYPCARDVQSNCRTAELKKRALPSHFEVFIVMPCGITMGAQHSHYSRRRASGIERRLAGTGLSDAHHQLACKSNS
ncbi:hypothetical protein FH972_023994 [Carpinus fangiana]|uniref:Uncharacterized protein n=1 Tax=Carpinus fangiana TaxID=176857 RepID=A0A5N6KX56_9ROSI|nr:hypothetical protein FH972_023994 [Carpinus fangiana]